MENLMKKVMEETGVRKQNSVLHSISDPSSVVHFSISLLLVFFAWFFVLPTDICSYACILAAEFQMSNLLFIILSNLAGFLGLLVGGVLVIFYQNMKKLLLFINAALFFINIVIYVVPSKMALHFLLLQYFMLGLFVSVATYKFLIDTLDRKRYFYTGIILASIVTITAHFAPASGGATIDSVYTANFIIRLVVLILVILLNVIVPGQQEKPRIVHQSKPVFRSFLLMCVYSFILSFSMGCLTSEYAFFADYSAKIASFINTVPYVCTILIVFSLQKKILHGGTITYVANALLIVSIAFADFFHRVTIMSGIVAMLLYSAIAVNQLFIFDSTFEIAAKSRYPSALVGVGLFVFLFGRALGAHLGEAIIIREIASYYRTLITLVAIGSAILPSLRIELSNISANSIFRINPVAADRTILDTTTNQPYETEPAIQSESCAIYTRVANYDSLTKREKEVLDFLVKGYPNELIASTLFISSNTLKRHVQNIYNKLNVHNRAELYKLLHEI